MTTKENLLKELRKLQRDLNSSRLQTYREGDNSEEAMALKKEREVKLARFNEVLKTLNEMDSKYAKGSIVKPSEYKEGSSTIYINGTKGDVEKMYLDYVNNFLTIGAFADYYEISDEQAKMIIEEGRKGADESGKFDNGGMVNGRYLDNISDSKKNKILNNIANHYAISIEDAEQEVKDADAEMLYEYIANDASLRMDVYNDFKGNKFDNGGGVGEIKIKKEGTLEDGDHIQYELNVHEINSTFNHLLYGMIEIDYDDNYLASYMNEMYDESGASEKTFDSFEKAEKWVLDKINKDKNRYIRDFGNKMADGGGVYNENAEMVINNNKQIRHHTEELSNIVSPETKVPAWVVAKVNRSASDLSDATHYLEGAKGKEYASGGGVGSMAGGGAIKQNEGKLFNEKGEMLVYKKQSDTSSIYDVDVYEPRKTDVEEYSKFKYCKREKNGRECVYRLDKKALLEMIKKEKFIYSNGGGVGNEDLSYASKTFSKSSEDLVKDNLFNGEISSIKLQQIIGHEPNYPCQIVGSLKLTKCFLRPYYKI